MKRTPLKRGRGKRRTAAEKDASLEFKRKVHALDGGRCVVHDDRKDCEGPLQAAHVVSQQHLKKDGLEHLLWDPAGGFSACYRAHRRHDLRVEPIPMSKLPQRCVWFAIGHGLMDRIRRYYPEEDA